MSRISFSIIIPAYNAAATIVAAIQCCLAQSLPPLEVIVINDGSTDETETLVLTRFNGQIKYLALPQNSGPAAARNAGLKLAAGTHIAFQDADDLWHREKLRHLAIVLQKQPDIRFLFHPYTLSPIDFPVDIAMIQPARYPFWKLLLSNPIGTPCVVMQCSNDLHFDEQLHYMEDYELFLREAYRHGVFRIAAPFTRVGRPILSAGGQSSRRWKMRTGEIRAWLAFSKQQPFFLLAVIPLILFALTKHLVKSFFPPRTNY